jgi:hypothetical protein
MFSFGGSVEVVGDLMASRSNLVSRKTPVRSLLAYNNQPLGILFQKATNWHMLARVQEPWTIP